MAEENTSVINKTRVPIRLPNKFSLFVRHLGSALFAAVFPPKPGWKYLEKQFKMQRQRQKLWCWAAVAASVANYYDKPQDDQKQCLLVKRFLETGNDCCAAADDTLDYDTPCNRERKLLAVMVKLHCANQNADYVPAELPKISEEIEASRPLCLRIVWWPGPESHFVTIVGYNSASETLAVMDPDASRWKDLPDPPGPHTIAPIEISYKKLCTDYADAGGTWDQTYFTKNVQ